MGAAAPSPKKKAEDHIYRAQLDEVPALYQLRKDGLDELYSGQLDEEGVESLIKTTSPNKVFEQCVDRGSVYKIKAPRAKKALGYIQMKFQVIQGNNGICQLLSFWIPSEVLTEEYFVLQLSAIEKCIQEAGCYRIKGVASEREFDLIRHFDYSISAPRYRHSFNGVTLTFVPFSKTLYHPKL